MLQRTKYIVCAATICGVIAVFDARQASAQCPVAVTSYYPAQPVVSWYPVRRGLFGRRIVLRPAVSYATPVVAAPVRSYYYAPTPVVAAPVTTYYAAPQVTTYYMPVVVGY